MRRHVTRDVTHIKHSLEGLTNGEAVLELGVALAEILSVREDYVREG
jgi:hypothetical protein